MREKEERKKKTEEEKRQVQTALLSVLRLRPSAFVEPERSTGDSRVKRHDDNQNEE